MVEENSIISALIHATVTRQEKITTSATVGGGGGGIYIGLQVAVV